MSPARRVNILGLGLIGGSLGLALRERGWHVTGDDRSPARRAEAEDREIIDQAGINPKTDLTIVASPVSAVPELVQRALEVTSGVVTDVGSVKSHIVAGCPDPRFVGGHPMAGSELEGLDGADPNMFNGAVWVLTPSATTADTTFSTVAGLVAELGAEVLALPASRHDEIVSVVSHVPHLTAASLMRLASERSEEHAVLLRMAAGGFRDMTRIASGHPAIWLDICAENRAAISATLGGLIDRLVEMRSIVDRGDRDALEGVLGAARDARANLPIRGTHPTDLAEVRIPILDRPGAAAEIFTLAAELGVNVSSFEVVHSVEGNRGVSVLLVDASSAERYRGGLLARGFRPSVTRLA